MSQTKNLNLFDVDVLVDTFISNKKQSFVTLHRIWFKNDNQVSLAAVTESIKNDLRTGCVSFINKNYDMNELDSYLIYIVNASFKSLAKPKIKKKTEYVCPGCLFVGKENLIFLHKYFSCDECQDACKEAKDPKWIEFYSAFKKHNRSGFKCNDCKRFIPQPSLISSMISCPYIDCGFAGETSSLKKMHHPTSDSNPEILTVDLVKDNGKSMKDIIIDNSIDALSQLENKELLQDKIKCIKSAIDYQSNNVPYSSSDFTVKHKQLVYNAFNNLLLKYPEEMSNYLLDNSRSGGFQHKIFQEYIRLLENSLPILVSKNKKMYKIESLLDENLSLFDGISNFDATINSKLEIKNNTKEYYIGNRKATYAKPYYIGKLLNVVDKKNNNQLLDNVIEYSFLKIKMKDVIAGTEVSVTHLRVPPHYQMGGMVYVNRIRKKIVDRALTLLNK
jgi:hypothetical protein